MAFVASTARSVAEHQYTQEEVEPWITRWAEKKGVDAHRVLRMCQNARVDTRSSVSPIEEVFTEKPLSERNRLYREKSIEMGVRVSREAILRAGLGPGDIDLVISVSCTGFMIPSVDAYIIEALGMRPDTRRLPITEMGCAAGAVALSRAREYLRGFPGHRVLVVSVELATLTFQWNDLSMDNIVSMALFGDGAAAAVLSGRSEEGGPEVVDSRTHTLPDSASLMGFDLIDTGFKIILSKEIPSAVRSRVRPMVRNFLGGHGLTLGNITHLIFHPGGKRILEVYREELGVSEESLRYSRKVLSECGNVSSATVLMILDEILLSDMPRGGDTGLLMAMGPGFSIEQLLIRWRN